MRAKNTKQYNSGIAIKVVSAFVFLVFTVMWLYSFQGDVIAETIRCYSKDAPHYNSLVGATVIAAVLFLLQHYVDRLLHGRQIVYVLCYGPSMICLALLGIITSHSVASDEYGVGELLGLLAVVAIWLLLVLMARPTPKASPRHVFFTRTMWVNLLVMAVMIIGVVYFSNTKATVCYRATIENCIAKGDIDKALCVGIESMETDADLTRARVKALSQRRLLGERLFHYPVDCKGSDILSAGNTADHRLCALLVDRKLDAFANEITHYYNVNDSTHLPRHYREALILYGRQKSNPALVYRHPVTEVDYKDMLALEQMYNNPNERHLRVMLRYHGSYWYYYKWR